MVKLNNDLSELVKSHISIYENFENSRWRSEQLDFLAFRVDKNKMSKNSPFKTESWIIRDNPNWELTEYENVYKFVDEDKIVYQYVKEWFSPVAILQWYKVKIPNKEWRKISVYWKWLRLYYCWYIDWLADYIDMYSWEVIRADLCRDNKDKIPDCVVDDLACNITIWENNNRTYKWFWNKRSPLFIRIYDKTLDLAKDKNSMAWLYPERYTSSCRRIECKFTQRYAQSMTALEWLWVIERNWSVQKIKNSKRNYLKSAFYNLLMYIDFIPDRKLQYEILDSVKTMCNKKIKKLKDFISVNDLEND